MNLQHLVYAVEVHKFGSISKAAQNLYMSQPNLSNALKELETEIGTSIFIRSAKGMETTKTGEEFIFYATDVLSRFKRMELMYSSSHHSLTTLSVSTMRSSGVATKMAAFLNSIAQEQKPMRIKFKEATNFQVIEDVVNGEADLGIIRPNNTNAGYFYQLANAKGCSLIPLPVTPYSVLMANSHPLAGAAAVTAEMLKPYIEVMHGDFATPMYPFSEVQSPDVTANNNKKVLYVYDRGSLMDMLTQVRGTYMWTTATHALSLDTFHLLEKKSDAEYVEGKDAIIYKKSRRITAEMQKFISLFEVNEAPNE